jgi:hypothetical protein
MIPMIVIAMVAANTRLFIGVSPPVSELEAHQHTYGGQPIQRSLRGKQQGSAVVN